MQIMQPIYNHFFTKILIVLLFMKKTFQFILDTSSRKYICPGCGKKRFVRYLDVSTGHLLPEKYGRCDREINCGYHLNPYTEGFHKDNHSSPHTLTIPPGSPPTSLPPPPIRSYIKHEVFKASLQNYTNNNFVKWLRTLINKDDVNSLIDKYHIGTSKKWSGATVFWQVDQINRVRTGKIMLYNESTGERVKNPYNHITWAHKAMKLKNFNLEQCFFGEHLLSEPSNKTIAIVESEKTAIVANNFLPDFIWIATGSLNNINLGRFKPLANRKVVLWPDANAFDQWIKKADQIRQSYPNAKVVVSDLLEDNATPEEKEKGCDIADYLIHNSIKEETKRKKELCNLIFNQFESLNPIYWIIDSHRFPQTTTYNIETLLYELNNENSTNFTSDEYLDAYQAIQKQLSANHSQITHKQHLSKQS